MVGSVKIKLPLSLVLNEQFKDIFKRLCADPAVPKDAVWWLTRTARRVEEGHRLFISRRMAIIKSLSNEDKEKRTLEMPNENVPIFHQKATALLVESEPVETFFDQPIVLLDPLPPNSSLTATDLATLIEVGLIHNPDKNENQSPPSAEAPEAASPQAGNGTNDPVDGVAGRKEA